MADFYSYTIRNGDTVQGISQEFLEDTSRWYEIVLLNDLEYPFITKDGNGKTKKPGDALTIPIESSSVENMTRYEKEDVYEEVLGTDVSLFSRTGLTDLTRGDSGELSGDIHGDIETVSGLENLKQSLVLRLSTPKGTLLHNVTYGSELEPLLGSSMTPTNIQLIEIEVERTLRTDSRVQSVEVKGEVTIEGAVEIMTNIIPIGFEEAFEMVAVFDERGLIQWD